jgi:hypothetical protein
MSNVVGEIVIDVTADVGPLMRQMNKAEAAMGGLQGAAGRMGRGLQSAGGMAVTFGKNMAVVAAGVAAVTGAALAFAMEHVERAPCVPERTVIDVVTDGSGDDERRLEAARDEAIARGIRVNALVVNTYGAPAADWARQALVTPSGFVMEADGWQEVAAALRRKVTQEVSQR